MGLGGKGVGGNREPALDLLGAFLDVINNQGKYEKLIKNFREEAKTLETERLKISKAKDIDRLHRRAAELQEKASQERQRAKEEAEKLIEDTKAELAKGLEALSEEREEFLEYKTSESKLLMDNIALQNARAERIGVAEEKIVANLTVSENERAAGEQFRQRWQDKWKRLEAVK